MLPVWDQWHWSAPLAFLLLPLAALPWWFQRRSGRSGLAYSDLSAALLAARTPGQRLQRSLLWLRTLAVLSLVLALARPQRTLPARDLETQGLDLVVALDVSESMRAPDLAPSRLEAAKGVLASFLLRRPNDRLGLVVFSGASFTAVPLTTDHAALLDTLQTLTPGSIRIEGTAIGDGVLTALDRLLAGGQDGRQTPGRVILLATDGKSNRGVDPEIAVRSAAQQGVRVYVVGLGGTQPVPRFENDPAGRRRPLRDVYGQALVWEPLQETELERLAELGQGRYFRAFSRERLEAVLGEIAALERSRMLRRAPGGFQEEFAWPAGLALLCLVLERILARTRFRQFA